MTDHKPLTDMFAPQKAIPKLVANRLARWAMVLNEYNYSIEYRETKKHGNADALSRLLVGPDTKFDEEESDADVDTICMIKAISMQIKPIDSKVLAKEISKDPVLANAYICFGPPGDASQTPCSDCTAFGFLAGITR